jgi:hypothetical protein
MLIKKIDKVPDEIFQPVYEELVVNTDWNGIMSGKIPKWQGFDFIKKEDYHDKKFSGKTYGSTIKRISPRPDAQPTSYKIGALTQSVVGFWLRIPSTGPDKLYSETVPLLEDGTLNPDYIWNHIDFMDAPEGIGSAIQNCADWVYNLVGGQQLGRITVHSVLPNGQIARHRDAAPYFKYYHRFHLPITTNPRAIFTNDHGAEEHMEAQYVYLLNIADYHEVFNYGDTDRIHMLLDIALDHPNQSF